jgi:hypothetical protein
MQNIQKVVRSHYLVLAAFFLVSLALSLVRFGAPTEAAPLTSRSLSLSSNVNSGTATWTFQVTTSSTTGGFEFVICTTPLLGTSCDGPTGLETASLAGVGVSSPAGFVMGTTGNAPACSLTGNAAPASANTVAAAGNSNYCAVRVHHPTTAAAAGATTITLTNMPNPTAVGTFFVRIATYDGVNNTYTTFEDSGTVAQSVRAATNVQFKVQEILQVCAGATTVDASGTALGTGDTCDSGGITGYLSAVDLGIADPAAVRVSPVASGGTTQGNATNGFVMVRTNGNGGTTVQYRSVINSSGYDLKVAGVNCAQNPSTSTSDFCINSAPVTQAAGSDIVAGTEEFGMNVAYVNRTAGGTTALTGDANYDGTGSTGTTCTPGTGVNCWSWAGSTTATLGSSSGPIDDEALILKFAAASGLTTPSGLYQANLDLFAVPVY